MEDLSKECETIIKRLKGCELDEILNNPTQMLKLYPVRNPDSETTIFDEMYCLVNEGLLKRSYRYRFFFFLNTFLSSTKLPAHIVAAYMKRLSRLTLQARPRTLVILLKLIGNLIVRHPVLNFLKNRVDERARELEVASKTCTLRMWLEDDPFDPTETKDLKATKAMDSSIWEVMPLRFHRHPKVASAALYLGKLEVPDMEFDIESLIR